MKGQSFCQRVFLAWAWLAKAKGHSCHTKNQFLPKPFTEKTSKSAKYRLPVVTTLQKKKKKKKAR